MERFPVFHSRDPDETCAFLVEKQFRFDMAPRHRRELGAQLNGVYLPSMYLGYIEYGGAAVATTATSGRSDYWIQISLRGDIEVAAGREIIGCDRGHAALTSPKREPTSGERSISSRRVSTRRSACPISWRRRALRAVRC